MVLLISNFSFSFSFYIWALTFENPKAKNLTFVPGVTMRTLPRGKRCLLWLSKLLGRRLVRCDKTYSGGLEIAELEGKPHQFIYQNISPPLI